MAPEKKPQPKPPAVQLPRPRIEVLERGLQNVFGLPSAAIALTDPAMTTHWCNTAISGHQLGRYLDAGYLKVTPEMLQDQDRVSFAVSPEGYVTRGERHQEILLYTLKDWYRKRQLEKTRLNRERMNPSFTKQEVVSAASATLGDEAASYLEAHTGPVGGVKDSIERIAVTRGDE